MFDSMEVALGGPPASDLNYLGVAIGICGSIFINIGNNLVAMSGAQPESAGRLATIGWLVFAFGTVCVLIAFAFAAAAVVAPLESLQFVVNLIFNRLVKGIELTCRMVGGTLLILIGTAIVVFNGPKDHSLVTPLRTLEAYWWSPLWLSWLAGAVGVSLMAEGVYRSYLRALRRGRSPWKPATVLPVAFALASAPVGTLVQVMSKCLSAAIKVIAQSGLASADATAVFEGWYLYVTIVLLIGCGGFWVSRLNFALFNFDPILIIPLMQALFILSATVAGGIYFDEVCAAQTQPPIFTRHASER